MAKTKYRYNQHTLSYDKIELTLKDKLFKSSIYVGLGLVIGVFIYALAYTYIDSPKEKELKGENSQLQTQYVILNKKLEQFSKVLDDVQHRDDNIYRVIFEAEPIANDIRKAGFGGVNRYEELEGYTDSELIINTSESWTDSLNNYTSNLNHLTMFLKWLRKKRKCLLLSLPSNP